MRKSRILFWFICLIIAVLLIIGNEFVSGNIIKEKKAITVYAPKDMDSAFKVALRKTELSKNYKIVMVEDENADICVGYAKENDKQYSKFAFSPFIVAYNHEDKYYKEMKKAEVLKLSQYNDRLYEIDLQRIINEVISEGEWQNLGIKDLQKIKIFYPSEDTVYYNDFYDFMLVTVNNGIYPIEEECLKKATDMIKKFEESPYTEAVSDFSTKVKRVGGFPNNVLWIIPEKTAYELAYYNGKKRYVRVLYPINTVYFNYYIKGNELGEKLINEAEESNFYKLLNKSNYRNDYTSDVKLKDAVFGARDEYNVVDIHK